MGTAGGPATSGSERRTNAVAASVDGNDHLDVEIRRLYENEGWSGPRVARWLGCGATTVYARLARLGVDRRRSAQRRPNRPTDDELRRLYQGTGLSLRQIAQRFAVSPQAVRGWLLAADVARRPPGAAAPGAEPERIRALYEQGLSGPQVATEAGCSSATVYRRLTAAGVERRRGSAVERQALLDALAAGLSGPEMAQSFGLSVTAVTRALRREGLETLTQARRRRAGEHYAALLLRAEHSGVADTATLDRVRHLADRRSSPLRQQTTTE